VKRLAVVLALALTGCLGSAPVEDHGPGGPDMLPAPQPTQPTVPVDAGTDDGGVCGAMDFQLTRVPPNVMLVIDRSGSMGNSIGGGSATTKWTDLKNAVSSLVTHYDSEMRLGAAIFSWTCRWGPRPARRC
jgi:hypothetical protein